MIRAGGRELEKFHLACFCAVNDACLASAYCLVLSLNWIKLYGSPKSSLENVSLTSQRPSVILLRSLGGIYKWSRNKASHLENYEPRLCVPSRTRAPTSHFYIVCASTDRQRGKSGRRLTVQGLSTEKHSSPRWIPFCSILSVDHTRFAKACFTVLTFLTPRKIALFGQSRLSMYYGALPLKCPCNGINFGRPSTMRATVSREFLLQLSEYGVLANCFPPWSAFKFSTVL